MSPDSNQPAGNVVADVGLETYLAASLPGLSDSDLHDLVATVRPELELRVGTALSEGLTEAQNIEFDRLVDSGDDRMCLAWLSANKPTYAATVATERARLIAEVVQAVTAADPSAAHGRRGFAQIFGCSMDLIEGHLQSRELKYERLRSGALRVGFAGTEPEPDVVIGIDRIGRDGDIFAFTGTAEGLTFPAESASALHAFASDWNRSTWMPKALVSTADENGRLRIVAEIAVPAGDSMTRVYVEAMMQRCLGSMLCFFSEVNEKKLVTPSLETAPATKTRG